MTIVYKLHTDSIKVNLHGIHQKGIPLMGGVEFITECPVLPGKTFNQAFETFPKGAKKDHAHIGEQRSMSLYGAFIVYPGKTPARDCINAG
ncbi:hypothetical protein DPMN_137087 [Dreissena polymorpha]|uniref:Plastocyanin-like domain-containing protein n=1 Tax=Dreissena polymorpha TaxID=45954 RepID=A0A9D4JG55_DREPO|nr:hypothetical protein DPMN_137087 [Dreissena polymorpha]